VRAVPSPAQASLDVVGASVQGTVKPFRRLLALAWPLFACGALGAQDLDVRALPTPVELWRWEGSAQSLLSGSELLFVAGKGRVTAIDPARGEVVWSTVIGTEEEDCGCGHGAHVHVDDRLFVPIADSIAVVDTDDGTLVSRVSLGGTVHRIVGPPVVAEGNPEGRSVFVRFDARVGIELARLELGDTPTFERFGDRFVVVAQGDPETAAGEAVAQRRAPPMIVLGLDEHLQQTWRREIEPWAHVERLGERLEVVSYGETAVRRPLDPLTGEIGEPLPPPEEDDDFLETLTCEDGSDEPVELEVASAVDGRALGTASVVRRRGTQRWELEVPGYARECDVWGDRLLMRLERGTTRALLAVVRARTGELEMLLRLPAGVDYLLVSGGQPVLEIDDSLVGIDPLAEGPSEAATSTLEESVEAALALANTSNSRAVVAELQGLGPDALPIAAAALPELSAEAVLVVAQLVQEARYEPAAPALAALLESRHPPAERRRGLPAVDPAPRGDAESWEETQLALALAAIAGPQQVGVVARYANVDWPLACRDSLAALGRIGTPAALAAIDRALASPPPSGQPWYRPPAPPRLGSLSLAQARAHWKVMEGSGDDSQWRDVVVGARSATVPVGPGKSLVVFPSGDLGRESDLWVAETGPGSPIAGVFFLGSIGPCGALAARLRDGTLEVACGAPGIDELFAALSGEVVEGSGAPQSPPLRVPVGVWRRDADREGLGDLLEAHLALDGTLADTDGDGVADPLDPTPNARERRSVVGEEADLWLAALGSIWACDAYTAGDPLFVAGVPALDWRGRKGPTFTVPVAAFAAAEDGEWDLPLLAVASGAAVERHREPGDVEPLAPGERRIDFSVGRPAADSLTSVVLRRVGGRWVAIHIASDWPDVRLHH
jgi:hypothetical protein